MPSLTPVPDAELLPFFESALIDCWVSNSPPGLQSLITAIHEAAVKSGNTKRDRTQVEGNLRGVWARLQELGLGEMHSGKNVVRTDLDSKAGNAISWLNLSPVKVKDASVGTVARAFLSGGDTAASVPPEQQSRFRTAMRLVFDLPQQCGDHLIYAAADRGPLNTIAELPERVMQMALAAKQTRQSAKNLRTAVRAAMRHAAVYRLSPVVFPAVPAPSDDWIDVMNTYFPLAKEGSTRPWIIHARKGIRILALVIERAFPDTHLTLTSLTREQADQVITHLRVKEGEFFAARQVEGVLRKLAKHGVGPLAESTELTKYVVDTPSGPRPSIYLRDADGHAGARDWDAMLRIIEGAGLPAETVGLLRWYGQWVTLPPEAFLDLDCPWPPVLPKHRLSTPSLGKRSVDLRAWIGCALYECEFAPETLTPAFLFGEAFDRIGKTLIAWWRRRQAVLNNEGKKQGAAIKGSLHHILVSAGIVAYAAYRRALHARRAVAGTPTDGGSMRIDRTAEIGVRKSATEDSHWNAYQKSVELAGAVKQLRTGAGASGRKGHMDVTGINAPEFKNIHRIIEQTPPSWWLAMLDNMHARIRTADTEGIDNEREFHLLVQHAWELGLPISTGFRGEELCRLQEGVHLRAETLRVYLSANERKNVKPQTAFLQLRFLPADIRDIYMMRTLPWLKVGQHEMHALSCERRRRHDAAAHAARIRAQAHSHDFLIVNTHGRAVGDASDQALKTAVGAHGVRWKAAMMRRAIEAGLKLPSCLDYEFGRHCIRGAFGYAIFQTQGVVAAANYLGDSIATVELAYAGVDGANVDVSAVANFAVPDRGIATPHASHAAATARSGVGGVASVPALDQTSEEADYFAKEEQLRADLRSGILTREQYNRLEAQYRRRFGSGDVGGDIKLAS